MIVVINGGYGRVHLGDGVPIPWWGYTLRAPVPGQNQSGGTIEVVSETAFPVKLRFNIDILRRHAFTAP